VLYAWPPILDRPEYREALYQGVYSEWTRKFTEMGIEVLGSPAQSFEPLEAMLDSNAHLTHEASQALTRKVAGTLCSHIACQSVQSTRLQD
jgi:hypothetical protein